MLELNNDHNLPFHAAVEARLASTRADSGTVLLGVANFTA
jgi:hypothetical protein